MKNSTFIITRLEQLAERITELERKNDFLNKEVWKLTNTPKYSVYDKVWFLDIDDPDDSIYGLKELRRAVVLETSIEEYHTYFENSHLHHTYTLFDGERTMTLPEGRLSKELTKDQQGVDYKRFDYVSDKF